MEYKVVVTFTETYVCYVEANNEEDAENKALQEISEGKHEVTHWEWKADIE